MNELIMRRREMGVINLGTIIEFTDDEFKRICVENWGGTTGGSTKVRGYDGELTVEQAAKVTNIGTVFAGNTVMEEADFRIFPNVTTWPSRALNGNTTLKVLYMPPITALSNNYSIVSCSALQAVYFQEGLTSIGYFAFNRTSSNMRLYLPTTLTYLQQYAISTSGTAIYLLHSDVGDFPGLKSNARISTIYVPDEYLTNYQNYLAGQASLGKLHPMSEWVEP